MLFFFDLQTSHSVLASLQLQLFGNKSVFASLNAALGL
jgi:hypothetical protein